MLKLILSFLTLISIFNPISGLECYNCFTLDVQGTHIQPKGEELAECTENKTDWNIWQCPDDKPFCSSMIYEELYPSKKDPNALESLYTILRTCSDKTTCSDPIPGLNVILCLLCEGDLCNGEDITPKLNLNSNTLH